MRRVMAVVLLALLGFGVVSGASSASAAQSAAAKKCKYRPGVVYCVPKMPNW